VRNSNHYGAAAYYSMMALEHGMIGISITNATPTMAPTGGRKGVLGNNPICVAVPTARHPALVLDMASGQVAKGKILLAHQDGRKIPLTWALDEHGHPTDDPTVALRGLVQPLGGYKGYGISLILDVLSGVLMGSSFGPLVGQMYGPPNLPCGVAHACAALRVECFMPLDEFRGRVDELIDQMHACALADGAERIFVAGEPEVEYERERRAGGIPVSPVLAAELRAIAQELRLRPPC
jgi:LDH2 family malate/lactate/ureidoglycolate dehydrogenase